MAAAFPRVLFLTPLAFNAITGTGVTFSNLFAGWPRDALLTVTGDTVPVGRDVCDRYFFLTPRELDFVFPFNRLYPRQQPCAAGDAPAAAPPRRPSLLVRLGKRVIGDAGIPDKGALSPELAAAVAAFAPQVIHTVPGSIGYIGLARALAWATGAPLVVHVMDDGVTDPRRRGLFGPYLRRRYGAAFRALLPRAARAVAICELMAEEYGQRFRTPFMHFQNTVDTAAWSGVSRVRPRPDAPFRLLYVGSITPYAQQQSLLDCCEAVKALNEAGFPVALDIATPLAYLPLPAQRFQIHPAVTVCDVPRTDAAFFQRLRDADGLLLPVDFDPLSVHFIRLSMPTKVPGYLASGTPILVYGPPNVAQVAYAAKAGWGHVVTRRDVGALGAAIRRLASDAALRRRLSDAALDAARKNHDAPVVREAFREMLRAVAREGKGA
jgi:glycosyltransferase involved in cell wall biosynthesis